MNLFIIFIVLVGVTGSKISQSDSTTESSSSLIFGNGKSQNINSGMPLDFTWLNENGSEIIDYGAIDKIFLHSEVADRKIVIVSITGPVKKGKSTFLNYCLRFLYANVSSFI